MLRSGVDYVLIVDSLLANLFCRLVKHLLFCLVYGEQRENVFGSV